MPTKDTKIITLRVPNRVDFGDVNLHKFITNLYDMAACGAIEVINNELVMPEGNCEECPSKRLHEDIEEIAHDKCVSVEKFLEIVKKG